LRRKVNMRPFDWKVFSAQMVGMIIGIGLTIAIAASTANSKEKPTPESLPFLTEVNDNPTLMHMHRREFIAAAIAQGLAAQGLANPHTLTTDEFAKYVLSYTDALMRALDK